MRDYQGGLLKIMNELAESVALATDEETLAESQEAGVDIEAEAENVRAVLRRSIEKFRESAKPSKGD